MAVSTDHIIIDVGGRCFKTSQSTLGLSGSKYFEALFGFTGTTLSGSAVSFERDDTNNTRTTSTTRTQSDNHRSKRSRDEVSLENYRHELSIGSTSVTRKENVVFVDRDPDLFSHILFYMRSGRLSSKTKQDLALLEDLFVEADYFIYDNFKNACEQALKSIKDMLDYSSTINEPEAKLCATKVMEGVNRIISHEEGQIVYIVSATLTGNCHLRRYEDSDDSDDKRIPTCYLNTCEKTDSGDFQLEAKLEDEYGDELYFNIAHLGLDQIHAGKAPVNIDFRQDLRMCLQGNWNTDDNGWFDLYLQAKGSGTWDVVYWVGDKSAIPDLSRHETKVPANKRRKISTSRGQDVEENALSSSAMLLFMTAMTTGVCSLLRNRL